MDASLIEFYKILWYYTKESSAKKPEVTKVSDNPLYPPEGYAYDPAWACLLDGMTKPVYHAPTAGQNLTDEAIRAADTEAERRGMGRHEATLCAPCSSALSKQLLGEDKRSGIVAYHVEPVFG